MQYSPHYKTAWAVSDYYKITQVNPYPGGTHFCRDLSILVGLIELMPFTILGTVRPLPERTQPVPCYALPERIPLRHTGVSILHHPFRSTQTVCMLLTRLVALICLTYSRTTTPFRSHGQSFYSIPHCHRF